MNNSINIYAWEKIKRSPLWYIFFFSISIFLIAFSFFKWWIMWWISVLFIFCIIFVSYIIMHLISMKKTILTVNDWYINISDRNFSFNEILWFNVELDKNGDFTNFVIIPSKTSYPLKYTINDNYYKTKEVIKILINKNVPLYSDYENDRMYKIVTFLKLW